MKPNKSGNSLNEEIMIVDDAVDSLKLLSSILEKAGYMIRTAERGELALCSIKSKRPSLVLLDVMMPEMDGFEVCRQLKADEKNRDIPVIFISALDDEKSKMTGFYVGGVDYISKPFRKEEVLARVGAHINLSRLQLELKKKNEELEKEIIESRQSKDRFKSMFEDSAVGMSVTNADGSVNINRAFCEILGYSEFELQNKKWQEITHPDDIQKNEEIVTSLLQGKAKRVRFEKRYVHKNGSIIWADVSSILHRDANNNSVYFITSISDITQRKQAEFALTESEDMFRKLAVSTPIAICIYQDDHWVYTNPAGEKLSGYTLEEYGEMSFWEFVAPEYQELIKTKAKERLTGINTNEGFEFRIIRKDGQPRWVYLKGSLITYRGKPAGLISVIDITEKKQMEDQLRRSEVFYRSIFEKNLAVMLLIDPQDSSIVDANDAAVNFYGWSHSRLTQMKISQINTLNYGELMVEMKNAVSNQRNFFQFQHRLADQTTRDVAVYTTNVFLYGKDMLFSIIHDISDRKRTERELLDANQKMDAFFNQSLDGFFFMMLDEPVDWNEHADKEQLLEYAISNQRFTKVNNAMLDQYGATREHFIGLTFNDLFGNNIEQGKKALAEIFDKGKLHTETMERKIDGTQIIIEGDYTCLYDSTGRITGHFGIQRDVTESKKIAEVLKESEGKYRYLFENTPAPMWIYDLETLSFLEVNDSATFHYGYSRQEFLNMTLKDICPTEDIERLSQDVKSTTHILNQAGTWRHRKKDGGIIYVNIVSHLLEFEGKTARLVISTDITERVNTQLEIQKEKQLLRTLIDNLPVSIYVKDAECRKVVANLTNVERMGYTDEAEVLGKTDLELYEGEIGVRRYNDDLLVVKNGKPIINKEEFFINPDGSCRWSLTSKIPLLDMQGKVTGIVGIGRDITEQKKASETIQKLSKGIEQNPSSIIITDIHGNIEYVNPKFSEITGYSTSEIIGQNPRILKSGEMPDGKYKELWETISSGGVWRGEFHNRKKNGELYWEWATMTSIKNDNEEITNYIAIKEDISLRKQMETELVLAKEKAEQSDRLKSAFLANMSHEIRTPLNSIIGFSELLTDPGFDEGKKKDFIRYIVSSGNNLLNIINDIMDISKIESGQIAIHKTKIQVSKFLDEIRALHIMKVEERHIGFRKSCLCSGYENNIFVLADKNRLSQIFNNLIGNALKFTSEGYIEVGCRPVGNEVEFHVKDTGIGISTEFHDKIFERFRQVDFSTNRKFGGNGLGLAITKNLIELMGGRIRVESEPGKGSTFYFTLPSCQL